MFSPRTFISPEFMVFCIASKVELELHRLVSSLAGQKVYVVLDEKEISDIPLWLRIAADGLLVRPLDGNFSAQRNALHALVPKGEWICVLDSDETVDIHLLLPMVELKMAEHPNARAFALQRRNVVTKDGVPIKTSLEWQPRIYRCGDVVWKNRIHEELDINERIHEIPVEIGHVKELSRCAAQHEFYEKLKAQ
jgi:hypothetical protein